MAVSKPTNATPSDLDKTNSSGSESERDKTNETASDALIEGVGRDNLRDQEEVEQTWISAKDNDGNVQRIKTQDYAKWERDQERERR